ncbi:MAG: hypothetical protein GX464_04000, partial [Holophagae bacterium]|nr:hypothetical protein [Holophagae bacterium]
MDDLRSAVGSGEEEVGEGAVGEGLRVGGAGDVAAEVFDELVATAGRVEQQRVVGAQLALHEHEAGVGLGEREQHRDGHLLAGLVAGQKRGPQQRLGGRGGLGRHGEAHGQAPAALLAAEHPAAKGQVFIVADNEPFSTRQLFEWICAAAGRKVPRWTMPLWFLRVLG